MPRYHFDVIDGDVLIDDEGLVFADYKAMQSEAIRAAGVMISELDRFPREPWTMIVRNEQRAIVATLTFAVR